jgi:hypothetical protein
VSAYEKILKSVLDDRTLTDAEARLIMYLAARPPGWTIYPALVGRDLKRSERHWVLPTLKLLHARGLLAKSGGRLPGQANTQLTYKLHRELIIASASQASDLGSAGSDITSDLGSAGSVVTDSVRTGSDMTRKRTDLKRELNPTDSLRSSVGDAAKGTRIPEDFIEQLRADQAQIDWFREECPDVDGRVENQKFMNYWVAKTGRDATKRDWVRTWRNWMLKAQQDIGRARARSRPPQPGEDGWVAPVSPFRDL